MTVILPPIRDENDKNLTLNNAHFTLRRRGDEGTVNNFIFRSV
ncbi:MAG TPA: hypothetical protein PLH80_09520 [Spirochaetota bacterium]|nr:hypothetical protein [Spirochaetota bacterium]HQG43752.1 hypothetical protein [Spirochaetota bacterium]HQI38787.1 hypothetical protein [Spirochaetota bacterium]